MEATQAIILPAFLTPLYAPPCTLACALGYQDLRFAGTWRGIYPRLVGWLDAFAAVVPAFEQTRFIA